jgi:hypothetical protein
VLVWIGLDRRGRSRASAPGVAVVSFSSRSTPALALIGNLGSLAVLYLLLNAKFVAGGAGARLRGRGDGHVPVRHRLHRATQRVAVDGRAELAGGRRRARSRRAARRDRRRDRAEGERAARRTRSMSTGRSARPAYIGRLFLTDHLLAFEITSIVLLVAAIGGVILGAHSRRAPDEVPSL